MLDTRYSSRTGHDRSKQFGKSCLHPGSTWVGVQRSGRNSYDVKVKIDTVDIELGTLAGTLEIKDLTPELESLVTFFEGEIISEQGPGFLTANYGATKEDDMRHWRRFPPFTRNRLEQQMNGPNLNLRGASKKPYLFMRWKERFVLPEHKVEAIHGASFAGLYYICLDFEPASSELFAEASNRSISPPVSRPFSFVAPLPRRRPSQNTPSQLAQTRPVTTIASPDALSPNDNPTPSLPIGPERPALVLRSVSYAAALVGSASSTTSMASSSGSPVSSMFSNPSHLGETPPTPSATPPSMTELPTPKSEPEPLPAEQQEVEPPRTTASFLDLAHSPNALRNGIDSESPSIPNMSTFVSESEWPVMPTSPRTDQRAPDHHVPRDNGHAMRSRGRKGCKNELEVEENFGIKSWTEATLSGFYHFACSEPYQQLSLRYVPSTNGASQSFDFA